MVMCMLNVASGFSSEIDSRSKIEVTRNIHGRRVALYSPYKGEASERLTGPLLSKPIARIE